jgi:hypothetical protein
VTKIVAYVAHPVAGDVTANLARALRWLKWLSSGCPSVAFVAPWIANIMSGEDDSDPAARARGLEHDVAIVKRCDWIVLVGGRISNGMNVEKVVAQDWGLWVADLTHLGDEPPAHKTADLGLAELKANAPRELAGVVQFDLTETE